MKVPGITIPDVPEAGIIDGDEMLLVFENSELRMKTIDMAKGLFKFPGFAPRLLASLAASSTAACASGVVTVVAAGHLITATIFDGWKIYYPGSPSLAAGWYDSFNRVDVDTITFSASASADFASESVNAGAAFVDEVTFESLILPANALQVGSIIEIPLYRGSNSTTGTKTIKQKIGGTILSSSANTSTSVLNGMASFGGVVSTPASAFGAVLFGTASSSYYKAAIDIGAANDISVTGQLSAASMYLAIMAPAVRIS